MRYAICLSIDGRHYTRPTSQHILPFSESESDDSLSVRNHFGEPSLDARLKRYIVIYTGLLLSLPAFSIDITLPVFAPMSASFGVPTSQLRLTVTLYIATLGVGQLIYGSLSDRFGRKPILMAGLIIFLAGTLVCMLAQDLKVLLGGRVVQGFGGAVAPVVARAMLRDMFSGSSLAKNMSIAVGIFSIGPILGPLLGVGLVELGGHWRMVFAGTAFYTIIMLTLLIRVPETIPATQPDSLKLSRIKSNLLQIVRNPQSLYFMLLGAFMMIAMILIISLSPALFDRHFGISGTLFALLFGVHGVGIIIGQLLNQRLLRKWSVAKTACAAAWLCALSAGLVMVLNAFQWLNGYGLSVLLFIFAIGFLSVISNSMSLALEPHGQLAGFASSVAGGASQIIGGLAASLLGWFIVDHLSRWAWALLFITAVTALLLWWWQSREITPVSNAQADS